MEATVCCTAQRLVLLQTQTARAGHRLEYTASGCWAIAAGAPERRPCSSPAIRTASKEQERCGRRALPTPAQHLPAMAGVGSDSTGRLLAGCRQQLAGLCPPRVEETPAAEPPSTHGMEGSDFGRPRRAGGGGHGPLLIGIQHPV